MKDLTKKWQFWAAASALVIAGAVGLSTQAQRGSEPAGVEVAKVETSATGVSTAATEAKKEAAKPVATEKAEVNTKEPTVVNEPVVSVKPAEPAVEPVVPAEPATPVVPVETSVTPVTPTKPVTPVAPAVPEVPKTECKIKGNISSSGERIYHMPGQAYYDRTKINESKGERWFCTEAEAVAAGWRKSKR